MLTALALNTDEHFHAIYLPNRHRLQGDDSLAVVSVRGLDSPP